MAVKGDASSLSYPSSVKSSGDHGEAARVELELLDPELVKKTWRKVDLWIMPIAVFLYLASYIDRCVIPELAVMM